MNSTKDMDEAHDNSSMAVSVTRHAPNPIIEEFKSRIHGIDTVSYGYGNGASRLATSAPGLTRIGRKKGRESKKPDNSLHENTQHFLCIPNEVESGGEFDGVPREISFNDPGEREYYEELVQTFMEKEGMSQDEAGRQALQAIRDQSTQEEIPF